MDAHPRAGAPWPDATIVYLPATEVLEYAERTGRRASTRRARRSLSVAASARFEVLEEHFAISDPAVAIMAGVVRGADVSDDRGITPESAGLMAIADGFAALGLDDHRQLALELPVYGLSRRWRTASTSFRRWNKCRILPPLAHFRRRHR